MSGSPKPKFTPEQIIEYIETLILDYDPTIGHKDPDSLSTLEAEISIIVQTILEEIEHDKAKILGLTDDYTEH